MDPKLSNVTMSNSLKRKRDSLAEDTTPGDENGGTGKKMEAGMNNDVNVTDMAVANTANGPVRAAGIHADLSSSTTESNTTSIDTTIITVVEPVEADDPSSRPSRLQTMPRELRDQIYELIAATEERIVLGWRMVEARRNDTTRNLYECFKEAIALHPLSMTCRQFRDEFQRVHVAAAEPYWVLVVNNFNLVQFQHFSDFVQSKDFIELVDRFYGQDRPDDEEWEFGIPVFNRNVCLRLQMDDLALDSASILCQHVFWKLQGEEPHSVSWLGLPEIVTEYTPRTTATRTHGMTLEDATGIESVFEALEPNILAVPDFLVYLGDTNLVRGDYREPDHIQYMQWCWFDEFYYSVELMRGRNKYQTYQRERVREIVERAHRFHAESK